MIEYNDENVHKSPSLAKEGLFVVQESYAVIWDRPSVNKDFRFSSQT